MIFADIISALIMGNDSGPRYCIPDIKHFLGASYAGNPYTTSISELEYVFYAYCSCEPVGSAYNQVASVSGQDLPKQLSDRTLPSHLVNYR